MTTFADLIRDTRNHLMTAQNDRLNVLNANINAVVLTLDMTYENRGVERNTRICIDLEEMMVMGTSESGGITTLTVARGFNGSTPAAHTAGAFIYIQPQFSDYMIGKRVNVALNHLSGEGLFRIRNKTITSTVSQSYDLTGMQDYLEPWRLTWNEIGVANNWHVIRRDEWWVDQSPDATEFPSGLALFHKSNIPIGRTVNLAYKATFDPLNTVADDVLAVSGLHTEAHDIPPMYAAITLLAGREVKRTFMSKQPEPRRQEEVPVGGASQAMRPLIQLYEDRRDREIIRLKRRYPAGI